MLSPQEIPDLCQARRLIALISHLPGTRAGGRSADPVSRSPPVRSGSGTLRVSRSADQFAHDPIAKHAIFFPVDEGIAGLMVNNSSMLFRKTDEHGEYFKIGKKNH